MEVHGIDAATRGYRVSFQDGDRIIRGLVPETLVVNWLRRPGTPSHSSAYEFIAAHRKDIEKTLVKLTNGEGRIGPPYDVLMLEEEQVSCPT